jgi:thiamine biosynthesis protein ThiS
MRLQINGESHSFADPPSAPFTLTALIESLNMKSDRVAVELNREIAARETWPQTILKEGDRLEIVHFVGGGLSSSIYSVIPAVSCVDGF